jgi:putative transposase
MPWQERQAMSLKIEFVERAATAGANISALCREFGISRETGHKWQRRFRKQGYDGLVELSRRPAKAPLATAEDIVLAVLSNREAHPKWGPKKLLELLRARYGKQTPSRATIARILHRFGQVRRRRRRAPISIIERVPRVVVVACNDVWTVDFKGWWRAGDGDRCEPLTVRDGFSRFILCAKLLAHTTVEAVRKQFEVLFRRYGLPKAIQCDNGQPFISVQSRAGLTRLSAWWVSLGIAIVRSRPGCPQDNGAHERMHRDMRADVEAFPQATRLREQRALDRWRQEFNHVRPHEALRGKTPAKIYKPGPRRSLRLPMWRYPLGWTTKRPHSPNGRIFFRGENLPVGRAFIGHRLGVEPRDERSVRLWLRDVELGDFDVGPETSAVDAACARFIERSKAKRKAA